MISCWTDETGNINQIKTINTPPTHVFFFSILLLYLLEEKVRKYFFQLLMLLIQLKVFWNIWFLSWQKNSEAKEKTPHCFNMTIHSMLKVLLKCNFEVILFNITKRHHERSSFVCSRGCSYFCFV